MRHGQWKRRKSKFEKRKRRKEERGINILQEPGKKDAEQEKEENIVTFKSSQGGGRARIYIIRGCGQAAVIANHIMPF